MDHPGDYEITEAMIRYGGGFVSGLGRLYRQADTANQRILREAFPHYFSEYIAIAIAKEALNGQA